MGSKFYRSRWFGSAGFGQSAGTPTPAAPQNQGAPIISGTAAVAETLTVSDGSWSGYPAPTFTYQWKRNGSNIVGATSSTYTVQVADRETNLLCAVTATNTEGSASSDSNTVVPTDALLAPSNSVAPAITGTASTGSTLTSSSGFWNGFPTPTYAYQWKRNGASITSATNSTYTLQVADEGANILCTVTATNSSGSASANSNTVVPTGLSAPVNTVAPSISGTATYGNVLTCNPGTWTGNPTPELTYYWYADNEEIFGENSPTYTTVLGDVGKAIKCGVLAANSQGTDYVESNEIVVTSAASQRLDFSVNTNSQYVPLLYP